MTSIHNRSITWLPSNCFGGIAYNPKIKSRKHEVFTRIAIAHNREELSVFSWVDEREYWDHDPSERESVLLALVELNECAIEKNGGYISGNVPEWYEHAMYPSVLDKLARPGWGA